MKDLRLGSGYLEIEPTWHRWTIREGDNPVLMSCETYRTVEQAMDAGREWINSTGVMTAVKIDQPAKRKSRTK